MQDRACLQTVFNSSEPVNWRFAEESCQEGVSDVMILNEESDISRQPGHDAPESPRAAGRLWL